MRKMLILAGMFMAWTNTAWAEDGPWPEKPPREYKVRVTYHDALSRSATYAEATVMEAEPTAIVVIHSWMRIMRGPSFGDTQPHRAEVVLRDDSAEARLTQLDKRLSGFRRFLYEVSVESGRFEADTQLCKVGFPKVHRLEGSCRLFEPVKLVLEKDDEGEPTKWIEITLTEVPPVEEKRSYLIDPVWIHSVW